MLEWKEIVYYKDFEKYRKVCTSETIRSTLIVLKQTPTM